MGEPPRARAERRDAAVRPERRAQPAARCEDRGRRHLRPVRPRGAAHDLRERHPQRVRPRVARQRQPLRADQRVGRGRQHSRHARRRCPHRVRNGSTRARTVRTRGPMCPASPTSTADAGRLPVPRPAGRVLRPPQPHAVRVGAERRQPDERPRSGAGERVSGRDTAGPQLARCGLRLRQEQVAGRRDRVSGRRVRRRVAGQTARGSLQRGRRHHRAHPRRRRRQHRERPDGHPGADRVHRSARPHRGHVERRPLRDGVRRRAHHACSVRSSRGRGRATSRRRRGA